MTSVGFWIQVVNLKVFDMASVPLYESLEAVRRQRTETKRALADARAEGRKRQKTEAADARAWVLPEEHGSTAPFGKHVLTTFEDTASAVSRKAVAHAC